jgi:hypothetical protein
MFKEIYACVRSNQIPASPPYPTFRDGLRELVLCEKILESNRRGAWVKTNATEVQK